MGCGEKCTRFFVGIANAVVIIGAIIAGVYLYMTYTDEEWVKMAGTSLLAQLLLGVAGAAILSALIGLCTGCVGARCCRVMYLGIIIMVLVLEVVCIVLAYMFQNSFSDDIGKIWDDSVYDEARHACEKKYKCCGWNEESSSESRFEGCSYESSTPSEVAYCEDAIKDAIVTNVFAIMIGAICLATVELVLLFCAIYLVCHKGDPDDGIQRF